MNVAKNSARHPRRPLPPRPPSYNSVYPSSSVSQCRRLPRPVRGGKTLSHLHESQLTTHKSRLSTDFYESRVTSHESRPALHNFGANKSFRFRSYRHPARNPFRIRSYKNTRGVAPLPSPDSHESPVPSHRRLCFLTTFRINTCVSVASKRLYLPLESTLMKKPGEGGPHPFTAPTVLTRPEVSEGGSG